MKIDTDVSFLKKLPVNPFIELWRDQGWVLHTYEMKYDPCTIRLGEFYDSYLTNETQVCGRETVPFATDEKWFNSEARAWYANFIVFWLGAFASPELLHMGYAMKNIDWGVWQNGWGDQQ